MAILSNINDLFRVDSAGAVYFATSAGANLQVLQSVGTGGSPIWVDVDDIIGGPYLPLAGGTLTGNLALTDASNNPSLVISTGSLTVGGNATFSSAVFTGGKLGVGTSDPGAEGYSFAEDLVILGGNSASDGAGITIRNNGKRYSVIAFGNGAGATGNDNDGEIFYDQTNKTMHFRTNHSPTVTFTNVGKVVAATATVAADSANTLTTKGYVDGLPQGDLTAITVGNGLAGTSLSGPIPDLTMSGSYTGTFTSTAVETASITLPGTTLTIGTRLDANTVVIRGFYANGGGKLSFLSGYASQPTYNWTTGEIFATDDGSFNGRLEFRTGDDTRTGPSTKMTIRKTGAIAFGTSITNYGTSGQVLTSAGNATPTWTTPTTGTVTGAGSLNFLSKYLSNGTDIGNSILKDSNGQLSTSTAQSVLGIFQGTTASGYAEFHLKNDAGNLLVMGSIGSGYTSADYTNATYLYNSGSGRNFWIKSQNDLGFFSGGTTIASHKRMTILSAGNIQMTTKLAIGATTPQNYRLQLGLNGSLVDSIAMGNYAVAKNTRQYIGYTRADTGLFEESGDGDTPSTVLSGVAGIRIVNTAGTVSSGAADNSVQLLTHIYNGGSRVALHARYDGNIGIGTTSPNEKLQLAGNLNAYAPGGIDAGLFASTAAGSTTIALRSNGVTHFNGGNVGIGTTSPATKLQVGDRLDAETITVGGFYAAGGGSLKFISGYASVPSYTWTTGQILATDDGSFNGRIEFKTGDTGRLGPTTKMVIKNNGKVGIGTTSPNFKLGLSNSTALTAVYQQFTNGTTGTTSSDGTVMGIDADGDFLINNQEAKEIKLYTSDTQRMRILTDGNVIIGTETSTACTLKVSSTKNGSASSPHFCLTGNGYTALHWLDTTAYNIVTNSASRDIRISANSNGVKLTPGATAWVSNSDIALKENLRPLENVLDKIKDYRCVEYNLKNSAEDKKIGFIAQDWVDDFPAIVDKDEKDMLGMKYTETIPVLLKAIQELTARVKELENK